MLKAKKLFARRAFLNCISNPKANEKKFQSNMIERKIHVGTSGWMYKHWGERFYPKDLKKDFLQFYSNEFSTVEINSSFYHMPSEKTFSLWYQNTPANFIFAVKLNRYITHRKRLILDDKSKSFLVAFLNNAQCLKNKLSVILIQLPPSFQKDLKRLDEFLNYYNSEVSKLNFKPLSAIEFRHESWNDQEVLEKLKENKIALVITSTPQIENEIFTANFTYIRMHGDAEHSSNYKNKELLKLKERIENYPANVKKIYIYFNNDYSAYAIDNARFLINQFK